MRKIILYTAISLNGKIARLDGSVDWLDKIPNPEKLDFGYANFYKSVDTTIMGFKTYQQIINWGIEFPYKGKKNFVLTRNKSHQNTADVTLVNENHTDFIRKLKQSKGKNIWLIGGAQANTLLLNAGLINELQLFTMPIILPDGIDLFASVPAETRIKLLASEIYRNGVVESKYTVENTID